MTDRDHFAAAALTGFASQLRCGSVFNLTLTAKQCYELAEAMLRERSRAGQNSSGGTDSAAKCTERDIANHDAAPAATAWTPGTGDTQSFDAYRRFVGEVMNWISEATGFLHDDVLRTDDARDVIHNACMRCWDAFDRIAYPTDHGASPEARASVDSVAPQPTTRGESDRTDKAAPRPSEGTGDTPDSPKPIKGGVSDRSKPITGPDPDSRVWETHTPATHATPPQGSEPREGTEPAAWATFYPNGSTASVYVGRQPQHAEPLYRHPPCQDFSQKNLTLTDCERGAIERAVNSIASTMPYESQQGLADWKTLRGLLRRLGGGR